MNEGEQPGGIQTARLYNQIMKRCVDISLAISSFLSLCLYLWLQHEASYMRKLPMNETTVDTKRI